MPITITNVAESNFIFIAIFLAIFFLSLRKSNSSDLFGMSITQELKGLGILSVVFSHIAYMLVTNEGFMYPLSTIAGVGVDLFLFMSGYGLSVGMLKKPLPTLAFYKRRMIKIFIPFWIALILFFAADIWFLNIDYSTSTIVTSLLGWFPTARGYEDVNSPLWYITWMIMFYLLFPIFFSAKRLWLTALLLALIANIVGMWNPFDLQDNWLHRLHTFAFSLGMLLAWLLQETKEKPNRVAFLLKKFRDTLSGIKYYTFIGVLLIFVGYMALHSSENDWPIVAKFLGSYNYFIGQISALLMMAALIVVFSLKRVESKFLSIFGIYSYEIYLLHWPLMSRYDIFFGIFPAWLGVFAWLLSFVVFSWLLQKINKPISVWLDAKW
jgi:peptidoglycan/LPS O-acetylase OafA/YrhL